MNSILVIAKNTYREIIRDRILYGIVVFALFLIGLSLILGELSFLEQVRISANFGLAGIQLGSSILAVFIGSSLVAKEIEKQTILTLLARPITRTQFLLGKYIGLVMVILTVMTGLAVVLSVVLGFLGFEIQGSFFVALFGIVLEALLLIALAMFFGAFARPVMTVIFTGSVFLIGHWVGSLEYFIEKSKSGAFKATAGVIRSLVPDLEKFNWRSAPIYSDVISLAEIVGAVAYGLGWVLVLLSLTSIIFRRRDFV